MTLKGPTHPIEYHVEKGKTMSRHAKDQEAATLIEALASERHLLVTHRRRQMVWIVTVSVSAVAYALDVAQVMPFGFAIQHVEEVILTTGVIKVIG